MNITIIGTGYVGLVSGTCLSDYGHNVTCFDLNKKVIDKLNRGEIHIFEPRLSELVVKNLKKGSLRFSNDEKDFLSAAEAIFICVGTPELDSGKTDLSQILSCAEMVGKNLINSCNIFIKSTVPVGTSKKVKKIIETNCNDKNLKITVSSNPEFLKEGDAVNDFMKPERVILGSNDEEAINCAKIIYEPFTRKNERLIIMSTESSELTKYAANSFLATKISFMNELANLCEGFSADIEEVRKGIGTDARIGNSFLYPGCGYGGSCFPKDISSLIEQSKEIKKPFSILESVKKVNQKQKHFLFEKSKKYLNYSDLQNICLWGLSFKPNTDDIREAPSIVLIENLLDLDLRIHLYDPVALENIKKQFPKKKNIFYHQDKYDALKQADALFISTEWDEFWNPDFDKMKDVMKGNFIFDGRNIYNPKKIVEEGFQYLDIGRSHLLNQ